MATTFDKLINIDVNTKSLSELEKISKQIAEESKSIEESSKNTALTQSQQLENAKQIETLTSEQARLTGEINKREQIQIANSNKIANNLKHQQETTEKIFKVSEGIAGAFQVGIGASTLFGEKTGQALQEASDKVMLIVQSTDGLKKISEGASAGFDLIGKNIAKSEKLSKLFGTTTKAAIAATGIGLLVIALGLIIANFDKVKKVVKEFLYGFEPIKKVLTYIDEFLDKIGGISGIFTVIMGAVKGFGEAIKNVFTNFSFDGFGETIKKASIKAVNDAIVESNKQKLILLKQGQLDELNQLIAFKKASGENTLKLEKEFIDKSLELNQLKLDGIEKDSDEEKELVKQKNAFIVQNETNRFTTVQKLYDDNLKLIEDNSKKETIILNDKLRKGLITEKEYDELSYSNKLSDLNKKRDLLISNGKSLVDIDLEISSLRLENQNKANEKSNDLLQQNYTKSLTLLENNFTSEYDLNLKKAELDKKFIEDKLKNVKKGSDEEINLQKELADFNLNAKQNENKRLNDLDKYYSDVRIKNDLIELNNEKNTINQRLEANEKLYYNKLDLLDSELEEIKATQGKESAAYKIANDKKFDIEKEHQDKIKELKKKQLDQAFEFANKGVVILESVNEIANQQTDKQIEKINENLEVLNETTTELDEKLNELNSKREESLNRSNELESKLSSARGSRFNELKQQLELESLQRIETQKKEDQITKQKIENEKKIEAEKVKIEKLELERKRRQKAISIIQATISTAQGVTSALGSAPPPLNFVLASLVGALGAVQIATIASQKLEKGGLISGNLHSNGGVRVGNTGIEVEGGEFVVNRKATQRNYNLLKSINESGLYQDGGVLPNFNNVNLGNVNDSNPTFNINSTVSVVDINEGLNRVSVIESGSSF